MLNEVEYPLAGQSRFFLPGIKLIVVLLVLMSNAAMSQTGWFLQTSPTAKNLQDVFFINSQTGWACGDSGKIIKTTNGGNVWTLKSTPTNYTLRAIRFSDSFNGYAAGGDSYYNPFCIDYTVVIKTTNGGESWQYPQSAYDPWDIYYEVAVLNKDTVFTSYAGTDNYCMGSSGGMYSTFNGGSNWNQFGGGWMKGITFINSNTGWTTTFGIGDVMIGFFRVYKTTNTGVNWYMVYGDTTWGGSLIGKIRFVDENNGYTLKNMLRKTTNGGVNWQIIDSANTYYLRCFTPINKDTLWIVKSSNSVLRTNNSGVNWTQQLTAGGLNSIYFPDKNTGWIVGNSGIIYKTVTGGVEDMDYATYFPMHTGDFFVYYEWNWPNPNNGVRFKASITKDTLMNGHKYFYLTNFPDIGTGWVRYDSTRTNLLYYFPNANCSGYANDRIIDSLGSRMYNQVNSCVYHWSYARCEDTTNMTLFNNYNTKTKSFRHDGLMLGYTRYAKNFGLMSHDYGEPPPSTTFFSLKGCLINGVLYGDTLLTNVLQISTEVPCSYSLSQNYPNPFNPATKIKFEMPKAGDVKIVVYNVMGREVQTLVDGGLQPGKYEVSFNGENLPSGVYFYKLTADGFTETKKMLMIK